MSDEEGVSKKQRHKGKHDKDKPWDDPSIDHWKVDKFDPSWNESGMLDVSSFSTMFPRHKEKYLQDVWPTVKSALHEHGIKCELNLVEGTMSVSTTKKTKDPYIIVKARDLIKLLSRGVRAPQARFVKRRQHLLGPNNSTLKALEILTGCYILVEGNTVAAMGSFKGLKQVRRIVEDCIQNKMHPIYHIKILMVKRELANDPTLANENWDRFLPKFKKKNVQKKKAKGKEKKPYTPFPPPPQPSKIDQQLESGEYFLSEEKKTAKQWQQKQEKQAEKTAESKRKRDAAFVPPEEPVISEPGISIGDKSDVSTMAQSLKEKAKAHKRKTVEDVDPHAYVTGVEASAKKKVKPSKS
ncbi:hypothetical protein KSS87_014557 [Heliosperma pusillum]|nr:hypothetical protein KSS87_014557 [Heliosperma pusillum]